MPLARTSAPPNHPLVRHPEILCVKDMKQEPKKRNTRQCMKSKPSITRDQQATRCTLNVKYRGVSIAGGSRYCSIALAFGHDDCLYQSIRHRPLQSVLTLQWRHSHTLPWKRVVSTTWYYGQACCTTEGLGLLAVTHDRYIESCVPKRKSITAFFMYERSRGEDPKFLATTTVDPFVARSSFGTIPTTDLQRQLSSVPWPFFNKGHSAWRR